MIADKLQKILQEIRPGAEIRMIPEGRSVTAVVIDNEYATIHDIQRQIQLWRELGPRLTEWDRSRVDFVFTLSPAEWAAMEAQAARAAG